MRTIEEGKAELIENIKKMPEETVIRFEHAIRWYRNASDTERDSMIENMKNPSFDVDKWVDTLIENAAQPLGLEVM